MRWGRGRGASHLPPPHNIFKSILKKRKKVLKQGHAVAVSRWLPIVATRVRVQADMGFVVDKEAMGQVFSEYFGFPCQSSFHQFLDHHNLPGLAQ
jgi:hypothetical protein